MPLPNARTTACLVFLSIMIALWLAQPAFADPPIILSVILGEEKPLVEMNSEINKRLKTCGYDVRSVQANEAETLKQKLSLLKLPEKTFVWTTSHGGILSSGSVIKPDEDTPLSEEQARQKIIPNQQGFHFLKDRVGQVILDGELFQKTISAAIKNPQIFASACFSGACQANPGVGLAVACDAAKKCYVFDEHPKMLVDLLCSAVGDCVEFKKADRDGNGLITPAELNQYWGKRLGYLITKAVIGVDNLEKAREQCDKLSGNFKMKKVTHASVEFTFQATRRDKTTSTEKRDWELDTFLARFGYPGEPGALNRAPNLVTLAEDVKNAFTVPQLGDTLEADLEKATAWLEKNKSKFRAQGSPIDLKVKSQPGYQIECHFPEIPDATNAKYGTKENPLAKTIELISEKCKEPLKKSPANSSPKASDGDHLKSLKK